MMVHENLKSLQVAIRGGGRLISHRPVFSPDGSSLYVIQSSKVLTYATASGHLTAVYTTPGATQIANIHAPENKPNRLILFTTTGRLIHLNVKKSKVIESRQINVPKGWTPIPTFINFLYPTSSSPTNDHFLIVGYPQDAALPVLYSVTVNDEEQENSSVISKLCWAVLPTQHSVAMSQDGRFVVAIQEGSLYCKDMNDPKNCKWHSSGTRKFSCVAVHPTQDFICATGDDSGRVLIWTNVMTQQSPAKTVFHWHTLPVNDLTFTPEGSQLISGGGECTMLKWDVNDTTNKRTLPRMGLPIRHLSCSPAGELIAVSHADNCIQLVDAYNKIVGVVKNFTQSYVPGEDEEEQVFKNVFPAGINVDPDNNCLILNGRPGWLQCYDFKQNLYMYSLDVAHQNYITAERERVIPNAEVMNVAFSKSGLWMATSEGRINIKDGLERCTEVKLKFWKRERNDMKGHFLLNTCIDYPHESPLQSLKFSPVLENYDGFCAVSSGKAHDLRMKVWMCAENEGDHGLSEFWFMEHARTYKDLPAGPANFSSDGSLLAGSFGRMVTLWDMSQDACQFKMSLCHARLTEDIKILEFGQTINSHLLICCTNSNLIVWDLITSSLLWVAPLRVQSLCVDPLSNLVAAATVDFHLFFFTPDTTNPLAIHKNVSKSAILSCAFIPNRKGMESVGLKSTVVFMNSSQELSAIVPKDQIKIDGPAGVFKIGDAEPKLTPFAEMVAEKTVNEVAKKKKKQKASAMTSSGQKAYSILREIMDQSPHTMPSVTYYCSQLMRALSTPSSESDRLQESESLVKKRNQVGLKKQRGISDDDDDDNEYEVEMKYSSSTEARNKPNDGGDSQASHGGVYSVELNACSKMLYNTDLDHIIEDDCKWIDSVFKN